MCDLSGDGNDVCRSDRPRTVDPTMFLPFMQLTNHPDANVRLGKVICNPLLCVQLIFPQLLIIFLGRFTCYELDDV